MKKMITKISMGGSVTSTGKPTVDWKVESDSDADKEQVIALEQELKEQSIRNLKQMYIDTQALRPDKKMVKQ